MYTIKLLLENKNGSYAFFHKMFFIKFKIQNALVSYAIKQIKKLENDRDYIQAKKDYAVLVKDKKKNKEELKKVKAIMSEKVSYYGLTKSDLQIYAKGQQYPYKNYISSQMVQDILHAVLDSIQDYLYGDGEIIHYKRFEEIHTVGATSLTNGIKLDLEKNDCIFCKKNNTTKAKEKKNKEDKKKLEKCGIIISKKDEEETTSFKKNDSDCFRCHFIFKNYDHYIKECFEKDIPFIKYCKIVREPFNSKDRYYVQFTIDSTPILKIQKGIGTCGIDPGVSSIAVTTDSSCMLEDLAPEIKKYNEKIIAVQKKMERSRRLNNKRWYRKDGTIKKGAKFKKTRNYKHLNRIYRTLHRKRSCYVKQNQERIANNIIEEVDTVNYEGTDFKALAKKAKETKRQDKISIVQTKTGEKQVRKFKRKKRFGKTLNNKSPGQMIEILKQKCSFYGIEVKEINTKEFKASQYNHQTDEYHKKELSERWNLLKDENGNEIRIQRDLYSSFLIKNSVSDLTHADRDKCIKDFPNFVEHHDRCIKTVSETNNNRLSCFGF